MNEETNPIIRFHRLKTLATHYPSSIHSIQPPTWLLMPLLSLLMMGALWVAVAHPTLHAAAPAQADPNLPTLISPQPAPLPTVIGVDADNDSAMPQNAATNVVTPTHLGVGAAGSHVNIPGISERLSRSLSTSAIEEGPALVVTKTVGLDPGGCAATSEITVTKGTQVVYCYFVLNTGDITFTRQTVVDSELGVLLEDHEFVLTPQGGNKPAALFTLPGIVTETTTNIVTWTGSSPAGQVALDTDSATVNVVSVEVTKTVGIFDNECATTSAITVTVDTPVYYCYIVKNTSNVPLVSHTFQDSELGGSLSQIDYVLDPGEVFNTVDAGYTLVDTRITSQTGTVKWRAFTASGLAPSDSASARVNVPALVAGKTVGPKEQGCAANSAISVLVGTEVVYCYTATNTGSVLLTTHTVVDSQQGVLLDNERFPLAPGATVFFTTTQFLTSPTTSEMTWTAAADVQPLGGLSGRVETVSQGGTTVSVIPRANFTAIVFEDLDQNGEQREPEPGLSDARVTLISAEGDQIQGMTDAAGRSSFSELPPGNYTVTVDVIWPGGSAITTTANVPTQVVLAGGESKSEAFGFDVSDRVLLPLIVQDLAVE